MSRFVSMCLACAAAFAAPFGAVPAARAQAAPVAPPPAPEVERPAPEPVWGPPPPRWVQTPADGRLQGGVASLLTGGFMLGLGAAALDDNGGDGWNGGVGYGLAFAGGASVTGGLALLGFHFAEGSDIPRRSSAQVAAGSALTIIGASALGGATVAVLHARGDGASDEIGPILAVYPLAAAVTVTGFPLWLAGSRDYEGADGHAAMRSPAMIGIGAATALGGLTTIGASFVVLGDEQDGDFGAADEERTLAAGAIAATGAVLTSAGAALVVFGATDARLPTRWTPEVSVGPVSTLRWTF